MAMHVPRAPGFASMLKDGARHYEGLEEAVFRNIDACVAIAKTTRSTYGPHGQSKIVINHIGKQFVTNDAATILRELEVAHPAAKMLVLATMQQEQEAGDGTNLVFQLSGSLLQKASELIKIGLSVTQVAEGFEQARDKALEILKQLVIDRVKDIRDYDSVKRVVKTTICSKQMEYADFLSDLITKACVSIAPEKTHFNVDNIRVLKICGSGVFSSSVINGMVFRRESEGDVKRAEKCKVVVYSCPFDALQTETKGTVLIHNAKELTDLAKGEETQMQNIVQGIVDVGVKVVISGGKVGELALHYANKMGLMVVRLTSKFDVRRVCQMTGATMLPSLTPPTQQEVGTIEQIYCDSVADSGIVVMKQSIKEGAISTILLRGATDSIMDDIERCIDDGVNAYKCLTRNTDLVAGAGATEVELARRLMEYADTIPGLEQYAIREYARAFEVVPKALAENAGVKATEMLAQLYAKHQMKQYNMGVVAKLGEDPTIDDALVAGVIDLCAVKEWAIKFATSAACTVLRVDQIIMAKPAGGPKPRDPKGQDEDD
ncbi:T-complex protein 1 subunit theta [Cichlidogyrus casuarinus]|uniref:T-complex protein 1 subunit theta n=1 Tax=Cichlidogyrus casuarinus TaxID=1844966 RepID=A0ABD2Q367_9PLAT